MDDKEKLILQHYKYIIEKRLFDEYDVLGFLIFIRRHIKEFPCVLEFSDLVAHRERNKGIAMECISVVQNNEYTIEEGSKRVVGYNGVQFEAIRKELNEIGKRFDIQVEDVAIREICVCIFSLAQFTTYKNKNATGKITLNQGAEGMLSLSTTEGKNDSVYVTFSTVPGIKHIIEYPAGIIDIPVQTVRKNGTLALVDNDKVISIVEERC